MIKAVRTTLFSSAVLLTASAYSADIENEDLEALRDWINSKRMITVKELGGALSISGDVHAEYQGITETINGKRQRRGKTNPADNFDVEFNLLLDYRAERSWAAMRLRFDNNAGILNPQFGSGKSDKIKLDRAFFGVRIIDDDHHTMDFEAGRRSMGLAFDSKLEFGSNFDGLLFTDNYAFDWFGTFYYKLGTFLINENKMHVGYMAETGVLDLGRSGFYTKYSLIDWDTKHVDIPEQFRFIVSQLILGYKMVPQIINRVTTFYVAGLYNHRAQKLAVTRNKRANYGGYAGFSIGQLKLKGDWSVDANYQVLAAQCVPDFDSSGVGIGNTNGIPFYFHEGTTASGHKGKIRNTSKDAQGNINYRGFQITVQYLLLNNLNLFQQWSQSVTLDDDIGPFRRFKQYEIDLIYLF
jgi:hypothetical protein